MSKEMGLHLNRTRFLYQKRYIPLDLILFEDNSKLGFFDRHAYKIALNKKLLLHNNQDDIDNILRHELGHMIAHLNHPNSDPHGTIFHNVCREFGWDKIIWKASFELNLKDDKYSLENNPDRVLEKLKKLLSLAGSDNINEANLALLKANQLLLKYNIEHLDLKANNESTYMKRILGGKKSSAKHTTISEILKTFFVYPIFSYGHEGFYIEIIGSKTNVELAEYIGNFLDSELERLWDKQKEEISHRGPSAKNSFMKGLLFGYQIKMEKYYSENTPVEQKALVLLEKNKKIQLSHFYPKLSRVKTRSSFCSDSYAAGIEKGKGLNISPALNSKNSGKTLLLN